MRPAAPPVRVNWAMACRVRARIEAGDGAIRFDRRKRHVTAGAMPHASSELEAIGEPRRARPTVPRAIEQRRGPRVAPSK